jgi:UDP-N-acetylglucosamine acyltransferase
MPENPPKNESNISPLAQVHPDAVIGEGVTISAFCYIEKDVVIGDNTWIGPNVSIFEGAIIGQSCQIFPGAVIAAVPQDLKFGGEKTTVESGDHTIIRECVTIHRGTKHSYKTTVGNHCLLMAYTHIAHDCQVGNHVIMANCVQLAGHVTICDYAILEGLVAVQQFITVGEYTFIAGGSLVRKSVPPYVKAAREPLSYIGVNKVGLSRRGFSNETITHIQNIYRHLFVTGHSFPKALSIIRETEPETPERERIFDFIQNAKGIMKGFNSRSDSTKNNTSDTSSNGIGDKILINT